MNREKLIEMLNALELEYGSYMVHAGGDECLIEEVTTAAIDELNKPQVINIKHVDTLKL